MTATQRLRVVRLHSGLLACGLAIQVAACGGGSSSPSGPDAASPDGACVATAIDAPSALPPYCTNKPLVAGLTDLSGTWVARLVGAEVVNAPSVGVMHNQTLFYILMTISQQGTALVADGRYCDRIQVNQACALAPVVLPLAWAHTESPVHRTGRFVVGADGIPVLKLDTIVEVFGASLASPGDALPTSPTDPRLVDVDNDGNPGLTIALTGQSLAGNIFSVQRQTTSVIAIPIAADRLEGALTFITEQNVLASVPSNLATLYSKGSSGADPTPCASSFEMVKIADAVTALDGGAVDASIADGGAAASAISCQLVRAHEASLFP
ncbi:MAG TPA: hypothetical protein VF524_08005 [Polyangia bacterium]